MQQVPRPKAELRFADIAEVNPRCALNGLSDDDLVSFIPMADVDDSGRWATRQTRPIREVRTGYTGFSEGDVLFAKITPCTENGKGCHATGLENGLGFGSTEFHVLRACKDVLPRLVYHLAQSSDVRWKAAALMNGSAGQQRVPADFFQLCRIAPEILTNQDAKCDLFDAVDDAIDATRRVIEQTRQLKTAVLQDLLTHGLPGQHTEFREIKGLGQAPRSWDVVEVGSLTAVVTSGSRGWSKFIAESGSFFVRSQNIGLGAFRYDDVLHVQPPNDAESERARIHANDLLVSVTGEPGNVAVADESIGVAHVSQHVALVRLKDPSLAPWIGVALSSPSGQRQFQSKMYGQTRPGLNLDNIDEMRVPIPQKPEREAICELMKLLFDRISQSTEHLEQLENTKTAISQALLTGHVRVPAVEASHA